MRIAPQFERMEQARHSSPVTCHSVKVHIEELVLHGFARGDRHRIAQAVETELARLMGEGSAPAWQQSPPAIERINSGRFKVRAGAKPQATGREIAQAVFRSLREQARAPARVAQA